MANPGESIPLLKHPFHVAPVNDEAEELPDPNPIKIATPPSVPVTARIASAAEWTVDGVPLSSHGSVIGEPMQPRGHWDSSLLACLGRNDEFCSSDVEVCLLGSFAPCVLHGSNVERLGSGSGSGSASFSNSCLPYAGLYMLGNFCFGGNWIAPWFSYPSRTAIRRRFNLEGTFEAFSRSFGCCSGVVNDEAKREQIESACDFDALPVPPVLSLPGRARVASKAASPWLQWEPHGYDAAQGAEDGSCWTHVMHLLNCTRLLGVYYIYGRKLDICAKLTQRGLVNIIC